MEFGIFCLVPVVVIIVLCIITKRGLASLLIGAIISYIMLNGINFFYPMMDGVYGAIMTYDSIWLFLMCLFLGSFAILIEKSGGVHAMALAASKYMNTEKRSLFAAWLAGIIIFFDDYLNMFVNGILFKRFTDNNKVPREMLAYVVDSTAAPVCLLVPISVWAAFFISLIGEESTIAYLGTPTEIYIKSIPFMFYAWVAVIIVLLVILGVIPKFGPMKKAWDRAQNEGKVYSDESAQLAINMETSETEITFVKGGSWNFILPMIAVIGLALYTEDALVGLIAGNVVSILMSMILRTIKFGDICQYMIDGFASMVPLVVISAVAFIVRDAFAALGIADYLIETIAPHMNAEIFPAITFVFVSTLAFVTVSCWGMVSVSIPIIIPLGVAVGANPILVVAAILSGSGFGSHACPYMDASLISSQVTGITPLEHFKTQFPYAILGAIVSTILFAICGFIF